MRFKPLQGLAARTFNLQKDIKYNVILSKLSIYSNVLNSSEALKTHSAHVLFQPNLGKCCLKMTQCTLCVQCVLSPRLYTRTHISTFDLLCHDSVFSLLFDQSLKLSTFSFRKWGLSLSLPLLRMTLYVKNIHS